VDKSLLYRFAFSKLTDKAKHKQEHLMFKLRKLNANGVAHHAVLMLIVVVAIAGFGAYQVAQSHADNLYTGVNDYNCFPGKKRSTPPTSPPCKLFGLVSNVKADCAKYFLQFDGTQCQPHCISNYHINDAGVCHINDPTGPASGGTSTGTGTGGGGTTTATPPTETECANLNRRNEDKTNNHCEECYSLYTDSDGKLYTYSDPCIKKTVTTITTDGAGAGTSTSTTTGTTSTPAAPVITDNAGKVTCAAQHKVWHAVTATSGTCGPQCLNGYQAATEGVCTTATGAGVGLATANVAATCTKDQVRVPGGECVNQNRIKAYCDSRNFKLTANGKNCSKDCESNKFVYDANSGTCIKKGTDTSTAAQADNPPLLVVDFGMDKVTCGQLGRQWVPSTTTALGNLPGCATNKCDRNGLSPLKNIDGGTPYCPGYVSKIGEQKCDSLHRVWIAVANGCVQDHRQSKKPGQTDVKNAACVAPYTTYVFSGSGTGQDACVKPSTGDVLKGAIKATGRPVAALAKLPKSQLCKLQRKVWDGNKCIAKKPGQGAPTSETSAGNGGDDNGPKTPDPSTGKIYCGSVVGTVKPTSSGKCPYLTVAQCSHYNRHDCGSGAVHCNTGFEPGSLDGPYTNCVKSSDPTECHDIRGSDICDDGTSNGGYPGDTAPSPSHCSSLGQVYASRPTPHCVTAGCPAGTTGVQDSSGNYTCVPDTKYSTVYCTDYNAKVSPDLNCQTLKKDLSGTKYVCYTPSGIEYNAPLSAYSPPVGGYSYRAYHC